MNHSRTAYWANGLEVWSGNLVKLKDDCGWWKRPETIVLFKVCKSPEEAKAEARKLNGGVMGDEI